MRTGPGVSTALCRLNLWRAPAHSPRRSSPRPPLPQAALLSRSWGPGLRLVSLLSFRLVTPSHSASVASSGLEGATRRITPSVSPTGSLAHYSATKRAVSSCCALFSSPGDQAGVGDCGGSLGKAVGCRRSRLRGSRHGCGAQLSVQLVRGVNGSRHPGSHPSAATRQPRPGWGCFSSPEVFPHLGGGGFSL